MGIEIGHEAHRDGLTGTKDEQFVETVNAVQGHTIMAMRMQSDPKYKDMMDNLIANDGNLVDDMLALKSGDMQTLLEHVDGNYDTSADYWERIGESNMFIAEEGDILLGLEEETGVSIRDATYKDYDKNDALQIGEIVNMGILNTKPDGASVVNSAIDSFVVYFGGTGASAWLGDDVVSDIKNHHVQLNKLTKIMAGNTTLANGSYSMDLADLKSISGWTTSSFVGSTTIFYTIHTGTKYSIVDFISKNDGFWDFGNKAKDGTGTDGELPGGKPYPFESFGWSESFIRPPTPLWLNADGTNK